MDGSPEQETELSLQSRLDQLVHFLANFDWLLDFFSVNYYVYPIWNQFPVEWRYVIYSN